MNSKDRDYYLNLFKDILDDLEKYYKPETVDFVMKENGMAGILQLRLALFATCHKLENMLDPDQEPETPDLN